VREGSAALERPIAADHDDLALVNADPSRVARRWASLPAAGWDMLEARVRRAVTVRDDFVQLPFPRLASTSDRQIAGAVESYKREAAVVDPRLSREVTLRQKATALADLCERLRSDTGVQLAAGSSVADEKVTLFCKKLPLRDVMRQLARPFGYTWLRSGKAGEFKYELVQDLRSQLLEEELRNRDHNEALLALDAEMQRYRKYLSLTPDEALARSKMTGPEEKRLLENLAGYGWGPIQLYFRLSGRDLATLRAGQDLTFSARPRPASAGYPAGEQPLPPDLARGVLQTFRDWTVIKQGDRYRSPWEVPGAAPIPVPALPEARTAVGLSIHQRELGRTALSGDVSWFVLGSDGRELTHGGVWGRDYVEGISPTVAQPGNATSNAPLIRDPALRAHVTVRPRPGCLLAPDPTDASDRPPEPRVTTADVLEALYQATGLPVVADHYTRLYPPAEVSVSNRSLFDALCLLSDEMRLRWRREGGWLQFRSTSYYDDRRKEVPNRLLSRWAAARRQHGALPLDDLLEIAQLSDDQLDAGDMAEGARACFGLMEWELPRKPFLRPHLRFLAGFTPAQRQEAMSGIGLPFPRMPLAQQQSYLSFALDADDEGLGSLGDLAGATLQVEYTHPGGFQWGEPGHPGHGRYTRWVIPLEPGPQGRRVPRPIVLERTQEAALQAVQRIDPRLREALVEASRPADAQGEPGARGGLSREQRVIEEEQIFPTRLDLIFVYIPGSSNARPIRVRTAYASYDVRP
jgi:hypothetical protein